MGRTHVAVAEAQKGNWTGEQMPLLISPLRGEIIGIDC